jgi:hypothetical protein
MVLVAMFDAREDDMNGSVAMLPLLAALLCCPATARAQDVPPAGHCPQLPAGTSLAWESRNMGDSDFCRALRSDGSEAFGLYISPQPNFKPRSRNREETTRIDGHDVTWYRAEIAASPNVQARETLLPLADGRQAHIWLQAGSAVDLAAGYGVIGRLGFAGNLQIAAGD